MIMSDIKYNEGTLKTQAEEMNQCYSQIVSSNMLLDQKLNIVGNYWQGDSFDEFMTLIKKIKLTQEVVMENFKESISKLEQITGVYTSASEKVRKKNEGLPTDGVFLE